MNETGFIIVPTSSGDKKVEAPMEIINRFKEMEKNLAILLGIVKTELGEDLDNTDLTI